MSDEQDEIRDFIDMTITYLENKGEVVYHKDYIIETGKKLKQENELIKV